MLHTVTLKCNNGSYQYQIFANLSAAGMVVGPKLDLATGVCVWGGGGGGGNWCTQYALWEVSRSSPHPHPPFTQCKVFQF